MKVDINSWHYRFLDYIDEKHNPPLNPISYLFKLGLALFALPHIASLLWFKDRPTMKNYIISFIMIPISFYLLFGVIVNQETINNVYLHVVLVFYFGILFCINLISCVGLVACFIMIIPEIIWELYKKIRKIKINPITFYNSKERDR